ncbi:MAG: carbonic anhydrase [Synechococcus sp.]
MHDDSRHNKRIPSWRENVFIKAFDLARTLNAPKLKLKPTSESVRHSIQISIGVVLGVCILIGAIAFPGHTFASPNAPRWTYEGASGPEHWGELTEAFSTCATGTQQSPIDLHAAIDAELTELEFHYTSTPLHIVNSGRTIQINSEPGSTLTLNGQIYDLLQFHFHNPSEHTVNSRRYPMEAHFVHQNADTGELAVVAILFAIGNNDNASLKPIWNNIPLNTGQGTDAEEIEVNVAEFLPDTVQENYRYVGSLTTPPCSESINWIVMKQPMMVSPQQVERFAGIVGNNARPIQPLGRRLVLD